MTISFDLDDTLIPGTKQFDIEKQTFLQKLAGIEMIRLGTIRLFKELKLQGHRVYIYTTSFRSEFKIRLTFILYGIPVDRVINQQHHDRELRETRTLYSKFPPAFGIDVHVDDSTGVKIEGEKFNFKTIIIGEDDSYWTDKVLKAISN